MDEVGACAQFTGDWERWLELPRSIRAMKTAYVRLRALMSAIDLEDRKLS